MSHPKVRLDQVAEIVQGGRHGLSGHHFVSDGYPAFGAGGLNGHLESFEFEDDGIVLSSIGARCGKCFQASGKWSSLANTQVIFPDLDKVDYSFLWYQLNDESSWPRSGTAQPFIKPSDVKARLVFFPALPEQRRLAAILDKADAIRRKRREALKLADEFLRAAFRDLFGDLVTNSKSWQTLPLGKLIESGPTNGLYVPASDYGSGTPILRIDGFYDGRLVEKYAFKRVRIDPRTIERFRLKDNSVVVNRVNSREYVGKAAFIDALPEPTVFESNMMNFTVRSDRLLALFLVEQFGQPFVRYQITQARKDAVNQCSINQTDIAAFRIRVPPLDLQQKFVQLVRSTAKVMTKLTRQQSESESLFTSLSHRAFQGTL